MTFQLVENKRIEKIRAETAQFCHILSENAAAFVTEI